MLGQWNFVGTLIGHHLEDSGGKHCFISVSQLLTCLLYAKLKLLQEEGQTPLPYRVTTVHPHLPPLQPPTCSLAYFMPYGSYLKKKKEDQDRPPCLTGLPPSTPTSHPCNHLMLGQWHFVGTLIGHYLEERIVSSLSLPCSLAYFLPYWSYFKEKREYQDRPPCLTGLPPFSSNFQPFN